MRHDTGILEERDLIVMMMGANVFADTSEMSREQWLEARRKGIGGSDASAILGVNPYSSPLKVYLDKVGSTREDEENEAMRQGRDLEDYVAQRFTEETGFKVQRCNRILQHPSYPWMLANIDRRIPGMNEGLECKTASPYTKFNFEAGEINPHYYWQAMHYMAVTGADAWYVAILVLGKSFHVFKVVRNNDEIDQLIAAEKDFWEHHVLLKVPPLPTGSEPDGEVIDAIYPQADIDEPVMELFDMDDVLNLRALKVAQRDDLQKEIEEIDQSVKLAMGTFEKGTSINWIVRWSNTSTSRIDTKALKQKYPEIAAEVTKTTAGRRFSIQRVKEQ